MSLTKSKSILETPTLYHINVPAGATIDTIRERDLPCLLFSDFCWLNLTESRYGTRLPLNPIQGGFLPMGKKKYTPAHACAGVAKLADQTERGFRLGTPVELLLYRLQQLPQPDTFVSLAKEWEQRFLCWSTWGGAAKFGFSDSKLTRGKFGPRCEVFIVEDL